MTQPLVFEIELGCSAEMQQKVRADILRFHPTAVFIPARLMRLANPERPPTVLPAKATATSPSRFGWVPGAVFLSLASADLWSVVLTWVQPKPHPPLGAPIGLLATAAVCYLVGVWLLWEAHPDRPGSP